MKDKPIAEAGYYAAKCTTCEGTGVFRVTKPEECVCFKCNGIGWVMRKMPKKVMPGNMERPTYDPDDKSSSYFYFRSRLKRYLLSHRGNKCEGCGIKFRNQQEARDGLEVHHIKPRSKGGTDDDENLKLLCYDCHGKQHHFNSIPWHSRHGRPRPEGRFDE